MPNGQRKIQDRRDAVDLGVTGRTFAIVGGTSGMGFATAQVLAADGAHVALIGRNRQAGEQRAETLARDTGAQVRMFVGDGTVTGSLESAIEAAADWHGQLHGLAVTAGPMLAQKGITELDDENWQDYFDVHVMTTVRACRAAIPLLEAAGGGTIVNTSAYSIRGQKPYHIAYTAMKAAIASITKNIAVSYGGAGIRANAVCPGFVATDAADGVIQEAVRKYGLPPLEAISKSMREDWKMIVALDRVGLPEELGELMGFLLSARASYVTGATINADGGTQF
jgi:3-oxoacyl-[acyl-carrier protein] reductase